MTSSYSHPDEVDFGQLLSEADFAAVDDALLTATATATAGPLRQDQCPLHPDLDDCLCNAFLNDWNSVEQSQETSALAGIDEPDYARFENWIPRFIRPEKPCDYCRSKRLQCYVQRGEPFCTPCSTLFRECSFTQSQTLESNNYVDKTTGTFLDTLHVVDEDCMKEHGTFTGIKPLRSKDRGSGSRTPVGADDAPGSTKRNGIRFPRHAVQVLRRWLDEHADNPYPTEEEKSELERATELKPSQINNWLSNARRRRKVTEKARPKLCMSPSLRPSSPASFPIPIPSPPEKQWDDMNPFERWKHSPPENEPADLSDIAQAIARTEPADDVSNSPSTLGQSRRRKASSNGSSSRVWSNARAPSLTSQETGQTSSLSASTSARMSNGSSHSTHGSFGSFSSSLAGKKDRRRRRKPGPVAAMGRNLANDKKRIFQCTFCTDTFKAKYDWTRHEKSLHLSLEKWICAPLGPIITDQESGNKKCVYCDLHNPSADHLDSHNHRQCEDKGLDARTFYRKDHLRQHLRLMHGCEMAPAMDSWKSIAVNINSRCGFCAQRFTVWQERVDHLTAHFKAGAKMSEWNGCRGLDPAVSAQVTNAMPPYLIGIESLSPNPFSASSRAKWQQIPSPEGHVSRDNDCQSKHSHQEIQNAHEGANSTQSTCWEILTVRLGKYAKDTADKGIQMTDEMLQTEARRILYDSEDTWNQTAADNPEWLDLFKKAHGLNFIPTDIGGQGKEIPEDLETYSDLGLRIPFAVQLKAYNQAQAGKERAKTGTRPSPNGISSDVCKSEMQNVYSLLSSAGVLRTDAERCSHAACEDNILDVVSVDGLSSPDHAPGRWCSQHLSSDLQEMLANSSILPSTSAAPNRKRQNNIARGLDSLEALRFRQECPDCGENAQDRQDNLRKGQDFLMSLRDAENQTEQAAAARAKGLNTLCQQETYCCPWNPIDHELVAARGKSRGVNFADDKISRPHCESQGPSSDFAATRADGRHHTLMALARLEVPQACNHNVPAPKKPYLQRHRYELPREKAKMFATTTGAWEDSGVMPHTVDMTLANIDETTTTGAMMEFLGPSIGQLLPFSNDKLTSPIDLATTNHVSDVDWHLPDGDSVSPEEMMDIINATAGQDVNAISSMNDVDSGLPWLETPSDSAEDLVMNDVSFDEMNFDDIFDMPHDETFGPSRG